jgi:hypothetical protein
MGALFRDVPSMLAAHRITAPEIPFDHEGYSHATMTRINQDGQLYVIKRVSRTVDWIIQMTSDHAMREAQIAASDVLDVLAPGVRSPSIAAARDGDGFALLMHDLAAHLLPSDGRLAAETSDLILARTAQMHARFWEAIPGVNIGWCGLRERLLMLSELAGQRLQQVGLMELGFSAGWQRFHAAVAPEVSALVRRLHEAPDNLIAVLKTLPQTLLHNDVKVANLAIEADTLWLFDWALAGIGPVCSDLGWLLAVNSSRLPWDLDETAERYAEHLGSALGDRFDSAMWERQRAGAHICGLMMLGWGKCEDPDELDWWCEGALEAESLLKL